MATQPTKKPRRKSTGKRLRFEIFKRDGFTCQYCGAQPPEIVLVVDHIKPVAAGGDNDPTNLITACEPCNQGKADKDLGDRSVRPDADLMYLETQQEIAEISRYRSAMETRNYEMSLLVGVMQTAWLEASDLDWSPADKIIRQFIDKYGYEATEAALQDVGLKVGTGYISEFGNAWIKYMHAVARNIMEGEE